MLIILSIAWRSSYHGNLSPKGSITSSSTGNQSRPKLNWLCLRAQYHPKIRSFRFKRTTREPSLIRIWQYFHSRMNISTYSAISRKVSTRATTKYSVSNSRVVKAPPCNANQNPSIRRVNSWLISCSKPNSLIKATTMNPWWNSTWRTPWSKRWG